MERVEEKEGRLVWVLNVPAVYKVHLGEGGGGGGVKVILGDENKGRGEGLRKEGNGREMCLEEWILGGIVG